MLLVHLPHLFSLQLYLKRVQSFLNLIPGQLVGQSIILMEAAIIK